VRPGAPGVHGVRVVALEGAGAGSWSQAAYSVIVSGGAPAPLGAAGRRSVTVAVGARVVPQTWITAGTVEVAMSAVAWGRADGS
jgi:hypothetical protein